MSPLARALSALVIFYQRALSPFLGARCRFEPSCSSYAIDALRTHGALRGSIFAVWRLLRCQPFGTPGYDPVPDKACKTRKLHRLTRGAGAC